MKLRFPTCQDLVDGLAGYGERSVIEWREGGTWRQYSAAAAARSILGVAHGLKAAGIGPLDRVAILRGSGPEYPLLVLGVMMSGAIAVPVDASLNAREVGAQLALVSPRLLLCSPQLAPLAAAASLGMELRICDDFAALASAPTAGVLPRCDAYTPCLLSFTSGSGGVPKGVLLPWGRVAFQIEQLGSLLHRPGLAFLSVLPPHHLLELVGGILMPLSHGERVIFANTLLPHELLALLRERDAGYLVTVPPLLELLSAQLGNWQPGPAFTGFICGGAALPERLRQRCAARGIEVYQGYGLTEAGPVVSTNYPLSCKPGTVGRPIPGVEVRVRDDGVIEARLPFAHAYCHEGMELPRNPMSAWIDTGDLGELDADGFLRIVGRAKQLMVLASGKKVHPEEVETTLAGAEPIEEVCVLGLPSRFEGSDEVVAVVRPTATLRAAQPDATALHAALMQALEPLRAQLAPWKWPTRFIVAVGPLPRTSYQKLRRDFIREQYRSPP